MRVTRQCDQGAMNGPNNVTCLSLGGWTGAIRSRQARIACPRFAASGLDRMSSGPAGVRHAGKANETRASFSMEPAVNYELARPPKTDARPTFFEFTILGNIRSLLASD